MSDWIKKNAGERRTKRGSTLFVMGTSISYLHTSPISPEHPALENPTHHHHTTTTTGTTSTSTTPKMPLYEIHHSHTLTAAQQRALATSITALHCSTFSAPSLFVNIVFLPSSTHFVGGAAAQPNYIIGHLRPRGPENGAKLATIVAELTRIWNAHVRLEGGGSVLDRIPGVGYTPKKGDGRLDDVRALHGVFLMEDIAAGAEQGFALPVAGQDGAWVRENMAEFRRRAEDGDEGMRALIEEVKSKL
jgi:phenylpyruvate tautomerase PptA (4-oxalocrotonate tautomerase family)